MAKQVDWKKLNPFGATGPGDFTPEELADQHDPKPERQQKWKIPDKIVIQAVISGGGAGFTKKHNPHHPTNLDEIRDEAEACIKAGATVIHLDNAPEACFTKGGKPIEIGTASYMYVVKPLLKKYGREKLCPHINCLRGTYQQAMEIVTNGITEISYINPSNSPNWMKTSIKLFQKYGVKAELVIHSTAKIEFAEEILVRPGFMPKPNMYVVLPHLPVQNRTRQFEYMPNERSMCEGLVHLVGEIRDLDPGAFIVVCSSGRATRYLSTLAMLLGLHIRVGMEDTIYKYPHKDDLITSNAEEVREAIQMARLLGREVATPNEYRKMVGLKPRFDFLPEGMK